METQPKQQPATFLMQSYEHMDTYSYIFAQNPCLTTANNIFLYTKKSLWTLTFTAKRITHQQAIPFGYLSAEKSNTSKTKI